MTCQPGATGSITEDGTRCPVHISKQRTPQREAQSQQASNLLPKPGVRCPPCPPNEEPAPHVSHAPSALPYRFVRGAADGEGGRVAAGFCHLQACAEVIVKHQLPVPDGQTQELTLGEAGWVLSTIHWCLAHSLTCLVAPAAGPGASTNHCGIEEGFMGKEQPCVGGTGMALRGGNAPRSTDCASEPWPS